MKLFGRLHKILENAQKLDEGRAWLFAVDNEETKDEIIRLNTEEQLYDDGIDSESVSLGEYALMTLVEKSIKGQRTDHVTLKDTGAFYDSFIVKVNKKGFSIIADDVAFYDRPLTDVYGENIIGLTDENLGWLAKFIIDEYRIYVRREILRKR